MEICFTGKTPYQPKKKMTATHCVPRANTVLCIGTQCNDGRPIRESWKYKEAVRRGCRILRAKPILFKKDTNNTAEDDDGEEVHDDGDEKGPTDTRSFVEKYRPTSLAQIIGHRSEIAELRTWLAEWSPAKGPRAVLLHGPPGIGKTSVAHLLAAETGYTVAEYNASDARSVSKLQGMFALGMKRLGKEIIIMDEVDGLSERGGVGEVATIIKRTLNPIICIANEVGPKLAPLKAACHVVSFSRPMRTTIANTLRHVCEAEKLTVSKAELESMCEKNGNDIRAILNQLDFHRGASASSAKDASHQMTPFRAAGALLSCGDTISWERAADMVFYDPFLVPMMVQEGYLGAQTAVGADIEKAAEAAEWISRGDLMNRRLMRTQDWSLLPHVVATTVGAARQVKGRAPAQIFPQLLGKMSKRAKHVRWLDDMGRRVGAGNADRTRMDYLDTVRAVTSDRLKRSTTPVEMKQTIVMLQDLGLTREDITEVLEEIQLTAEPTLPTKIKSAFTREWNKQTQVGSKRKATITVMDSDEEMLDLEEEMAELELGVEDE